MGLFKLMRYNEYPSDASIKSFKKYRKENEPEALDKADFILNSYRTQMTRG